MKYITTSACKRLVFTCLITLTLSACATITRGTSEVVVVETDPPNAKVTLSNGMVCEATPCSFKVPRKGDLGVSISKEGYKDSEYTLRTQVSGGGGAGMAGNVLVGGLIGVGVDASSGAMLDHKPNPLVVKLEPVDGVDSNEVTQVETTEAGEAIQDDATDMTFEPLVESEAAGTTE